MNRMFAPSPTVRASATPLYLRGLGQPDLIPPDIGTGITVPDYTPFANIDPVQPLLDQGFTPQEADMIDAAAANGLINDSQWNSILSGHHSYEEVANIIFSKSTPTVGPSPSGAGSQILSFGTKTAADIARAAAAHNKPDLGPGASPRVGTRPPGASSTASILTEESIKGIPNWALFAAAGVAMLAMGRR